jgi:hypothetical protein
MGRISAPKAAPPNHDSHKSRVLSVAYDVLSSLVLPGRAADSDGRRQMWRQMSSMLEKIRINEHWLKKHQNLLKRGILLNGRFNIGNQDIH